MYYRLVATCGTSNNTSPESMVTFTNPQILTTAPATRCGTGTATLGATSSTGTTINWFAASTGGSAIGTGTSFTTPSISTTTTYYASASTSSGGAQYVGPAALLSSPSVVGTYYLNFTVTANCTIQAVNCYFNAVGSNFVLNIRNATTQASVFTYSGTTTVSGTTTPQVLPLNATLTPGDYQMGWTTDPGTYRTSSGASYPYTIPGVISITGNTFNDANYYYYFLNWLVSSGCESARTAVVATVSCNTPVTLLNFKGDRVGSTNKLDWTTTTEVNNAGFSLQRSADGINFSELAFVASKAANGNSNSQLTYSFDDTKPFAGNSYYRLYQLDKDGKGSYSSVVLLKAGKPTTLSITNIYPNPTVKNLRLTVSTPTNEKIRLVVTDAMGKIVLQQEQQVQQGDNNIQLNVAGLSAGTYIIKAVCSNGCESAVHRFVKQ